jgi:nicotinamidase-related amidase
MGKALVVIDVQVGMFADPSFQPHDGEAIVGRIAELIGQARAAEVPIFFIQHDGGAHGPLKADGPGFPFREELTPEPGDDVTVKRRSSAFSGAGLDSKLRQAGIDELVVTGLQSEYCVASTVRGAVERGYKVSLVRDAHSTFDRRAARAEQIIAMQNEILGGGFATLISASDVRF